jgi:endonuclease/exonuclease/phosphatase family metal-dependent hydrolase
MLTAAERIPALVRHIIGLAADILCLQEVEADIFTRIEEGLGPRGYTGHFTPKAGGKPDGCAIFFRTDAFSLIEVARIDYRDGTQGRSNSGHIAQSVLLRHSGHSLGIMNTHLKWDPPGTPREEQYGYRQVVQLLAERDARAPMCEAWIVCGDLNATPESDVVATLQKADFEFTHHAMRAYTCNSNRRAKTIDYLFHNAALRSEPMALPEVDDHTPLPGPDQPSDHVAVMARFEWTE